MNNTFKINTWYSLINIINTEYKYIGKYFGINYKSHIFTPLFILRTIHTFSRGGISVPIECANKIIRINEINEQFIKENFKNAFEQYEEYIMEKLL